jgi:hypothetical protein
MELVKQDINWIARIIKERATRSPRKFRLLDDRHLGLGWDLLYCPLADTARFIDINSHPELVFIDWKQDILHRDGIYTTARCLLLLNTQTSIYHGLAMILQHTLERYCEAPSIGHPIRNATRSPLDELDNAESLRDLLKLSQHSSPGQRPMAMPCLKIHRSRSDLGLVRLCVLYLVNSKSRRIM